MWEEQELKRTIVAESWVPEEEYEQGFWVNRGSKNNSVSCVLDVSSKRYPLVTGEFTHHRAVVYKSKVHNQKNINYCDFVSVLLSSVVVSVGLFRIWTVWFKDRELSGSYCFIENLMLITRFDISLLILAIAHLQLTLRPHNTALCIYSFCFLMVSSIV